MPPEVSSSLVGVLRGRSRLTRGGAFAVGGVLCLAGMLFATSADTARGTDLREEDQDLRTFVARQGERLEDAQREVAQLRATVDELSTSAGGSPGARLADRADELGMAAQVVPVSGAGLVITLDDAPEGRTVPPGFTNDDLVVHQQDIQAVVNALWAGGAEAMGLMDQRVIATSAVRCVGSTLRLQGEYYPPPYRIRVVGDPDRLQAALERSSQVALYRQYADLLGLGYSVESRDEVRLPGYQASVDLGYATVPAADPQGDA